MSRAEREALFHKCAESMTSESITGWFLRSPGLQIWRDNVIDWLLWALFSVRNRDTNPEWEDELEYYITVMGEYVGYPLRAGSTPEIQCLRLTMDPVPMVHRPFTWYMVRFPYAYNTSLFNNLAVARLLCRYHHVHRALLPRLHTLQYPQMVSRLSTSPTPCVVLTQVQGHRDQHTLLVSTAPLVHETSDPVHPRHRHRSPTLYPVLPRARCAVSRRWHPRH
jgi:hypothetical protein